MRTVLTRARLLAVTLGVAAISVAGVMSASAATSKSVVEVVKNAKLHETILVNKKGFTLYSLSAEKRGRFICTREPIGRFQIHPELGTCPQRLA